jgi:hypothetical protein
LNVGQVQVPEASRMISISTCGMEVRLFNLKSGRRPNATEIGRGRSKIPVMSPCKKISRLRPTVVACGERRPGERFWAYLISAGTSD